MNGINKNVFVIFFSLACVVTLRADSACAGAAEKALHRLPPRPARATSHASRPCHGSYVPGSLCAHRQLDARLGAPLPVVPLTPWGLPARRLSELARLCLHDPASLDGPGTFSFGAMPEGDGEGLTWVELTRGLLVYWVGLQVVQGGTVVQACHVMAPTEWNFNPHGAVAQYIARLDAIQPADEFRARCVCSWLPSIPLCLSRCCASTH